MLISTKITAVGLMISVMFVSFLSLASLTTLQASSKGLKLYLTVDTNLNDESIGIETWQHGDNIYDHDGFMRTGSNEYTLNYPSGLVDNGQFEICIQTNDGRYCGNGYNSDAKRPESVFINAQEGRNFGEVQEESQAQSQSQSQDNEQTQSSAQSQDNDQRVIIYNCPADSKCMIEQ